MRNKLLKLLGNHYSEDNGNITDNRVQGYDTNRNVARIRENRHGLHVNKYQGYFYKPAEEKTFTSAEDAYKYIMEGRK